MKVFEKPGRQNTEEAIRIAVERAKEMGAPLLCATTQGVSGKRLCEVAKEMGCEGKIVICTSAYGTRVTAPGKNLLEEENCETMKEYGVTFVTAAHILSGVERAMSAQFKGIYPTEIIAHSLRMFSQGVKVAVEIGSMALDAGALPHGVPVVTLAGTGGGVDTVVIISPAHANRIFDTKIHEILCMPY